jgi:hypothetical protein
MQFLVYIHEGGASVWRWRLFPLLSVRLFENETSVGVQLYSVPRTV